MKKESLARERAARALCRFHNLPGNTKLDGWPMWESFLPALEPEGWSKLKNEGPTK